MRLAMAVHQQDSRIRHWRYSDDNEADPSGEIGRLQKKVR